MSIDEVIAALYASFSFERGERPDWELLDAVLARGARLVRVNDEGVFAFDAASFRRDLEAMIDSGQLTSFWEAEVSREVQQFGDIAHVLSRYEGRTAKGGELLFRAVKSMQLFRERGRWWVSALLWQRSGDAPPRWFA